LPKQIDEWFKAYNRAVMMCGTASDNRRIVDEKESKYLHSLYRGLYLKRDIKVGEAIAIDDIYSAIPWQPEINQYSSRDFIENDSIANKNLKKDDPLLTTDIN
jgi:N-acetylneuraminate synthase